MLNPRASHTDPAAWVEQAATHHGERTFLTTVAGQQLTYRELHVRSGQMAAALASVGIAPGDRVALSVDKSLHAVVLYVACLRLGAVVLPLNNAYTPRELGYFLEDAHPTLVVGRPSDRETLSALALGLDGPRVETLGQDGAGSLADLVRDRPVALLPQAPLPSSALAALLYTSGTTGRSKGAMLTRGNLASNGATLAECWGFTADDVLLHALPLFHVHGLFISLNTVLAAGASLLLVDRFDAREVLRLLPRVSVLMGVPTYYTRLLAEADLGRESTAHMRLFVSGSAPLLPETHREFSARTGHSILERYGMTETLVNASNPYDADRRPGSVGLPLAGTDIRVTATDPGRAAAAPGTVGMLEVHGPNVFAGYWNDAAKTAEAFTEDGYFVTGDLGTIDPAGYVTIVGRAKDLVISGGYNVYPKEIEAELDALPGVAESAVVGIGHPDLGEGVTAVVVPEPGAIVTEAELIAALQRSLARYKVPRRIVFVDELPRNSMGKVQKAALRQTYASLYARR